MSSPFTHDHPGSVQRPVRERVLALFEKNGRIAEIRERKITMFRALEWRVYISGSFIESRMYHGERLKDYGVELLARRGVFIEDGWTEVFIETPEAH